MATSRRTRVRGAGRRTARLVTRSVAKPSSRPAWLDVATEDSELPQGAILAEPAPADDLRALGRCAAAWSTPSPEKKGGKVKPLPESLQAVLRRLCGEEGEAFESAGSLLAELDAAGSAVPANAAAWERFVRSIRDQSADTPLRRSV